MSTTPATAAVLLVEVDRRRIELRAAGDRLRSRPRSAMTPALADRLAAHGGDLLATLAAVDGVKRTVATVGGVTVEEVEGADEGR